MSKKPPKPKPELELILDEPGMAEHFQRAPRKALNTPPKHRSAPTPKTKEGPRRTGAFIKGSRGLNISYDPNNVLLTNRHQCGIFRAMADWKFLQAISE
jgi:hypothetical protein